MNTIKKNIHTGARVRFRREILNADGSIHFQSDWQNNLILDQGLNQVPANGWPFVTRYAAVGTGTDEFERDSGTTTASRTGTTVTASAGFFVAGDANSLIRWDTGEQSYIVSYTSATEVEVADSGTIASAEFGVFHVDRTGLLTETKRTETYTTSPGCGTTWNGTTKEMTFSRTYLWSTEGGSVTYREVGWSPTAGAGANLFGGALIGGGGDSLVAGQQYKIVCELILFVTPNVVTAVTDVGTGCDTTGNALIEYIKDPNSGSTVWGIVHPPSVANGVGGLGGATLDPSTIAAVKKLRALMQTFTQAGPTITDNTSDSSNPKIDSAGSTYVAGNFYRDFNATFSTAQANGTIHGVCLATQDDRNFSIKFDTPFAKTNLQTLAVVFRLTWQRNFI